MTRATSRATSPTQLTVVVTDARGRRIPDGGLGRWLETAAPRAAVGFVSIALVSDAAMKRLNTTFRGVPHATDVLSFPIASEIPKTPGGRRRGKPRVSIPKPAFLGDLAIALGVAARQAREHGHALRTELRILALHGLLHLLGYDHETDTGTMQRAEDRLRRRARLPAGLVSRALRPGRTTRSQR